MLQPIPGKWYNCKDTSIIIPSYKANTPILVSDGNKVFLVGVRAFVHNIDSLYCQWKYWMQIPTIPQESDEIYKNLIDKFVNENSPKYIHNISRTSEKRK